MSPDEYVVRTVSKYAVKTRPGSAAENTANLFKPKIVQWAHKWLAGIYYSGSYAKGTAVSGDVESRKELQLHDSAQARVESRQLRESFVQDQNIDARLSQRRRVLNRHDRVSAATLARTLPPGVIDEDLPHQSPRHGELRC